MMQISEVETKVNSGIAPYSASYQRVLINTVLEDADGAQKMVREAA
jgi:hypothetical protein